MTVQITGVNVPKQIATNVQLQQQQQKIEEINTKLIIILKGIWWHFNYV